MKVKYQIITLITVVSLFFIIGCGSSISNMPGWYEKLPKKKGLIYENGTATSKDMQLAVNKATLDANNRLAGQLNSEMNALVQRAQEELGLGADSRVIAHFSQTQEQVISETLSGVRTDKKKVFVEEKSKDRVGRKIEIYRAYVLIVYDDSMASQRLLNRIRENELLYNAMRATELYEEMEKKVEDYRKRTNF